MSFLKYIKGLNKRWEASKEKADQEYYDMVEYYGFTKTDMRIIEVGCWILGFLILRGSFKLIELFI